MRIRFLGGIRMAAASLLAVALWPLLSRAAVATAVTPQYEVRLVSQAGWAAGLNESGQVAGYSEQFHAWTWHDGVVVPLKEKAKDTYSRATGLNDAGLITGVARGGRNAKDRAVVWTGKKLIALPRLPKCDTAGAEGCNARGDVVGWCSRDNVLFATYWSRNRAKKLSVPAESVRSVASNINDHGQIAGSYLVRVGSVGQYRPAIWTNGQLVTLPIPEGFTGGSAAMINDAGLVVGSVDKPGSVTEACVWQNGLPITLGTFGGESSGAMGANELGQVVGSASRSIGNQPRAFLWSNGPLIDLNDCIPADSGWTLDIAVAINNQGWILGHGRYGNALDSVCLLVPRS